MIRILLDQGLPRTAAKILRNKGWNVLHTGDIGLNRATDRQILEYARNEKRVVITLDSDFHSILAVENAESPSVIRVRREGLKGPELAEIVEKIWPEIQDSLTKGAIPTITENTIRIRIIPLYQIENRINTTSLGL